jgi:hypothetical protein
MATLDTEKEIRDLKRRLDLFETRLAQNDGRFEFITGQLRDIQLYMHARFADMDDHFSKINSKLDAMPRVIAELIAKRS